MVDKLGSSSLVTFLKTSGAEALGSAKSLGHTIKAKIQDFGKTLIKTATNITNIALKSDVVSTQKESTLPAVTKADQKLVSRAVLRAARMREGKVGQFFQQHLGQTTSEGVLSQDFVQKVSEELKTTMKGLPKEQQEGFANTLRLMGFDYTEDGELTCSDPEQLSKVLSLLPSVQKMTADSVESKEGRASRFFTQVKNSLHTPRKLADYLIAKGIAKHAADHIKNMDLAGLKEVYNDSGRMTQLLLGNIRSVIPKIVKHCSSEGISPEVLSKRFDKAVIKEMKKLGATESDIVQMETRRKVKEVHRTLSLMDSNLITREDGLSRLAEAFDGIHPGSIEPGDFHNLTMSEEIKPFVHALMTNLARDTYQQVVTASLFDRVAPEAKVDAIAGYFNLIEGLPPEVSNQLTAFEVPFDRSALMREYFSLAGVVGKPVDLNHLEVEGFAFTQLFLRNLDFEIAVFLSNYDSLEEMAPLLYDRDFNEFKQLLLVAEIHLGALSPGNREIVKNNLQEIVKNRLMQKVEQRLGVTREQIEQLKGVELVRKIQAAHSERDHDGTISFEAGAVRINLSELSPEQIVALRNQVEQSGEGSYESLEVIKTCDSYLSGDVDSGEKYVEITRVTNLSTLSKSLAIKLHELKSKELEEGEKDVRTLKSEMKVIEGKIAQCEELLAGNYTAKEKEEIGGVIREVKVDLLRKQNEISDKERAVERVRNDVDRLAIVAEESQSDSYHPFEITTKTLLERKELIAPLEAQIKDMLKLSLSVDVKNKLEEDLKALVRIREAEGDVEVDSERTFTFFATSESEAMTKEERKELKKPIKEMKEYLAGGEKNAASVKEFLAVCHSEDPVDQQEFRELALFDIDLVNASDAFLNEVIAFYELVPDEPGNEHEMQILALLKQLLEVPLENKEERRAIIGDERVDFVFEGFVENVHPDMISDLERYLATMQDTIVTSKKEINEAEQDLAHKETEAAFGPVLEYEETRETQQEVQESLTELTTEEKKQRQTIDLEQLCSQVDSSTPYMNLLMIRPAPGEEKSVAAMWKNWAADVVRKVNSSPSSPTGTFEAYQMARDYLSFREILPSLHTLSDEARKEILEALAEYEKQIPDGVEGLKKRVEADRLKMEPIGSDKEKAITPFERLGLELLTRYLDRNNSNISMSDGERRDLAAFLQHAQGNMRLNSKVSLMLEQRTKLTGISSKALNFMRTYSYKTRDFDKLPDIGKRFVTVMETLEANPNAIIEPELKLTVAELGLLTRAVIMKEDFDSLVKMGLLGGSEDSEAVGEFTMIVRAVEASMGFIFGLQTKALGQSRMRSGDLVFTLTDKEDAFFQKPNRSLFYRAKSRISRFGHAAVAHDPADSSVGRGGSKGLSHVLDTYTHNELSFEDTVTSETYRIDVAKLVRPEMVTKLKEKYGENWEQVIQDKFHRISSDFHTKENVGAKLGKVNNTALSQLRSGAALFFPFLRKKKPVDELYTRLTQGKPENSEEIEQSMICAEFVVQTTVAGTLRLLNDEIVRELGEAAVPDGKVFDVPFERNESLQYIHTEVIYKKFKKALTKVDPPPILSQILH